jgi:hypothetical protein
MAISELRFMDLATIQMTARFYETVENVQFSDEQDDFQNEGLKIGRVFRTTLR